MAEDTAGTRRQLDAEELHLSPGSKQVTRLQDLQFFTALRELVSDVHNPAHALLQQALGI